MKKYGEDQCEKILNSILQITSADIVTDYFDNYLNKKEKDIEFRFIAKADIPNNVAHCLNKIYLSEE